MELRVRIEGRVPVPLELCLLEEKCELDTFYPAAAAVVDYLVRFRGTEGLRDVLDGIARGNSADTALGATFGG
jgi:hypothetical protein